jgi:lysophospholipase L1-like esterase
MTRVALLGDSIFDNKAYVGTEPDVIGHLRQIAPDWKFDLHAVDGNLARHVSDQLKEIDDDVSYLVVSAGGNNAIDNADILQMSVGSSTEVLASLADRAERFEYEYGQMLNGLAKTGLPFFISTVYYPNFPEESVQKVSKAALATFNDVIISLGARYQLPILDLRLICTEPGDYANEIEPSGGGGKKIAAAIVRTVKRRISGETGCVVYY